MAAVGNTANNLGKAVNWYPGHMFSGMKAMMGKLRLVDCVIEIHDARLPLTGRNMHLKRSLGTVKPHILVLNKCDLADLSKWDKIKARLEYNGDYNILKTCLTGTSFDHINRGYDNLAQLIVDTIKRSDRYNREDTMEYKTMIVGIPNVGKSSLINRLRQLHLGRRGEPAQVGPAAGVTKHVMQKIKICSRPPIYVYDTPGVLQPGVTKCYDKAMRLAMCSTISDEAVGKIEIAKYIIDWLNSRRMYHYVQILELDSPVENLDELIIKTALSLKKIKLVRDKYSGEERRIPDIDAISGLVVRNFRGGLFGKVMIDDL